MASEASNVAKIAASIEGRCCRAVSQAMGANVPGQAGGLAQSANDPADRFPGKSNVRGRLGTVEAMEERAGFVAAGLDPFDQGGGRLIGQGHTLFLGPAFPRLGWSDSAWVVRLGWSDLVFGSRLDP